MPSQNATLVDRFYEEFCNGRKLDLASELFTAEHAYHDPSSPWVGPGPAGMQQLIGTYQSAFGDAHWHVDEMLEASLID